MVNRDVNTDSQKLMPHLFACWMFRPKFDKTHLVLPFLRDADLSPNQ
jgi:hypothetical protein